MTAPSTLVLAMISGLALASTTDCNCLRIQLALRLAFGQWYESALSDDRLCVHAFTKVLRPSWTRLVERFQAWVGSLPGAQALWRTSPPKVRPHKLHICATVMPTRRKAATMLSALGGLRARPPQSVASAILRGQCNLWPKYHYLHTTTPPNAFPLHPLTLPQDTPRIA